MICVQVLVTSCRYLDHNLVELFLGKDIQRFGNTCGVLRLQHRLRNQEQTIIWYILDVNAKMSVGIFVWNIEKNDEILATLGADTRQVLARLYKYCRMNSCHLEK